MKIKVIKKLNTRIAPPGSTEPPSTHFQKGIERSPGEEIDVLRAVKGENIITENGENDVWYFDGVNKYYWSGGVREIVQGIKIISTEENDANAFSSDAQFPVKLVNWNTSLVKIPVEIRNGLGSGINVGVLDTGVEKQHIDLARNLVDSVDFTNSVVGDLDVQGHGTEMISLIAANPFFQIKGIKGVAPDAKIYSSKVMYDENDPQDFLSVKEALDDLLKKDVDIVSMSIGRPAFPVTQLIQEITDKMSQANKTIFFAATKECNDDLKPSELINLFPANCSAVIPVCALTKDYINKHWKDLPTPLIIVPLFDAWCCSIKFRHYYFQDSGSSISTALVSGLCALILSHKPSLTRTKNNILRELEKYSSTIEEAFNNPGIEVHIIVKNN